MRLLKKFWRRGLWICAGLVLGFPLFSLTYYSMVRTSTPQFCASCHEIQFAYNTWKTSTHTNNSQGFVADCMDCHLPAPHDTWDFFYAKTLHGAKDITMHLLQKEYDHAEQAEKAYASFDNQQCMKCHRNILHIPESRGAMLAHRTVLFPREGYAYKCVDCHRNLVHIQRDHYAFKQYNPPYRATGL